MSLRDLQDRQQRLVAEMRSIADNPAANGDLSPEQTQKFDTLKAEVEQVEGAIKRAQYLDECERRSQGQPLTSGDGALDRELRSFSLVRAIASAVGITGVDAGREREMSAEIARRSGRSFQGIAVPMAVFYQPVERRAAAVASDPGGGYLVQTDVDGAQFIDRLRAALTVRRLGARVLNGLCGDLFIPRLASSVSSGWVAENQPLPESEQAFAGFTLSPKHCGGLTEITRQMLQQSSTDVESLVRADFAQILADAVDRAAINGSGVGAEPTGVLNTAGIGSVDMATPSWEKVLEFISDLQTANTDGSSFLTNPKVVALLRKTLKVADDAAGGFLMEGPNQLAGYPCASTTNVPGNLGVGANKSALIFGNWSDVLLGYWSELDILVNPYADAAFKRGNVQVRAMLTMDIGVRHVESFAAAVNVGA